MSEITNKLDLLFLQMSELKQEIKESKELFLGGMKAIQRAFEMTKEIVCELSDNVESFSEISGVF